jgi:hypothetical protein
MLFSENWYDYKKVKTYGVKIISLSATGFSSGKLSDNLCFLLPTNICMSDRRNALLTQLGFRFGTNGPHAARTMMLDDLSVLLAAVPQEASESEYAYQVTDLNVLGKPTKKARELAYRHLLTLYGLDPKFALFRMFRRLWAADELAHPVLALTMALARDPLLAGTQEFILQKQDGQHVSREDLETLLSKSHPDRFSPASLKSFAQNVNGTWTSAGYLSGRNRKTRTQPVVTPAIVAMCLFIGHLQGMTGQRLFSSNWCRLIPGSEHDIEPLAMAAYHRGLIVFLNAGGVKEVRFPDSLTTDEDQIRQELTHEF